MEGREEEEDGERAGEWRTGLGEEGCWEIGGMTLEVMGVERWFESESSVGGG